MLAKFLLPCTVCTYSDCVWSLRMLSMLKAEKSTAQEQPQSRRCISRKERVLLRWYRRLGKEDRAHVLRFVSAMAITKLPLK